jgi:hypothetical protein
MITSARGSTRLDAHARSFGVWRAQRIDWCVGNREQWARARGAAALCAGARCAHQPQHCSPSTVCWAGMSGVVCGEGHRLKGRRAEEGRRGKAGGRGRQAGGGRQAGRQAGEGRQLACRNKRLASCLRLACRSKRCAGPTMRRATHPTGLRDALPAKSRPARLPWPIRPRRCAARSPRLERLERLAGCAGKWARVPRAWARAS